MSVPDRFSKAACFIMFLCSFSAIAQEHPQQVDSFARDHQTRGQAVMDAVVPRLLAALSEKERAKLGRLVVNVIPSRDALRVQLEQVSPESNRLVVSVGFLILQDMLVDASVVAVVSGNEAPLVDYAVDVGKFALQANYPTKYRDSDVKQPKPFWQHIGWTPDRYAAFRDNPETKKLLSRATIQTNAWLVANAITDRLNGSQGSDAALRDSADLLVRARYAPVPALGASVLFFAAKYPDGQQTSAWVCSSRNILMAAISIGERDRRNAAAARAASIEARIKEWQRVAEVLDQKGECAGKH